MHTDNESAGLGTGSVNEPGEETQEEGLGWLLDIDRSDPEEKLFDLDQEEYQGEGLTEYEAELAARPLSRGHNGGDDLSMFVDEEIVVSSEVPDARIFGNAGDRAAADNGESERPGATKAIDHSQKAETAVGAPTAAVEDGSDILGLAEDDDMGEKYLTIKRVKSKGVNGKARPKPKASTVSPPGGSTAGEEQAARPEANIIPMTAHTQAPDAVTGPAQVADTPETAPPLADAGESAPIPGDPEEIADAQVLELDDITGLAETELTPETEPEGDLGELDLELELELELDLSESDDSPILEAVDTPAVEESLGSADMDLGEMAAALADESVESAASDDWLGGAELDLSELSDETVAENLALPDAGDWLGELDLEEVEPIAAAPDAGCTAAQDDEWLGAADLELSEMVETGSAQDTVSESAEAPEGLESAEPLEAVESFENLEIEETPEPVEAVEIEEPVEALEPAEDAEPELVEAAESEELVEALEPAEDAAPEPVEAVEVVEPVEALASVEPLETTEPEEIGGFDAPLDSGAAPDTEEFSGFSGFDELDNLDDFPEAIRQSGQSHEYDPMLLDMIDNWMDGGLQTQPLAADGDNADLEEAVAALEQSAADDDVSDVQDPVGATVEAAEYDSVEQEAARETGEDQFSGTVILSEAPVTSLVVEPGEHTVANEDPLAEEAAALDASGDAGDDNVLDYVAQHQAPLSDTEFDDYLLRGAHLKGDAGDLDALEVEQTEGIVSVDPSSEVNIDYHDDFRALEGFGESSISAITAVIADVMEEISGRARSRMEQRGMAADAIEVDVMLGTDPQSIKQCYAEGFEPVTAIVPDMPVALRDLQQTEAEAIYVRLFNGQTNENRNDLFTAEDTAAPEDGEQGEAVDAELVQEQPAVEPEAIFADDIFDAESLDQLDQRDQSGEEGDIDALFGDLIDEEDDSDLDVPPEQEAESAAPEVEAEAAVENGDTGFDEEMFVADLTGELSDLAAEEDADIDTVFAGLQVADGDSGEICGLDVEEFSDSDDLDMLEAVADFGESQSTVSVAQGSSDMGWCIPEGIAFNYTSQSSNEIFADFLDAFIEEGAATLEKLEDTIGDWERDVCSESAFAEVGRILHTLKGIAKGVGLQRYGTLIHNFETLLEGMQRPQPDAAADYFRIVNAWLDAAVRGLDFVQENRADVASEFPVGDGETAPAAEPVAEAAPEEPAAEDAAPQEAPSKHTVSEKAAARQKKRDQQLADEGAKVLAAQQSVRITSEKLDHLLNLTNQAQQLGVRSAQSTNRSKRASAELQGRLSSVRNHIATIADRALLNVTARGGQQPSSDLDALEMDQYSELQEAANILREAVEDLSDLVDVSSRHNAVLESQLKQQATVISTIGSSIQAARVVPVSRLMPGLRRIVRTVSADLNKSVAFKVLNETGALDRDHYARCQVVLEHMVRNALDHGIESPEERLAAGKPTTGRISIDVRKLGGDYFISLSDDGRGIDPYEMRETAFRKGLDIDVDALSDEEAVRLIFDKGLSTASSLSEISGRGVGMDIVLSELQQIGGDIQVKSKVGQGTIFEVHIPANVTVNGALFVTAGDNSYAIPLNGLIAVEQVPVAQFFDAVELRKTLLLFDMECEPAYLGTLCNGESMPDRDSWGDSVPVIIAGSEKRHMAIAIDSVEEALELVIRSLGSQFVNVPGVAGGATTADGEAIVALDLNLLVDSVAAGELSAVSLDDSGERRMLALVVDDSRTQRMVTTSQFDTVGVETITAENGLVAIDLLNTTHRLPDVVLLDIEMPVKDGIETLKEIRKSVRYKHLPVIMVTSRTGAKHRALAEDAGCNGYMGKPFNFAGLIEQINELTGYELQV